MVHIYDNIISVENLLIAWQEFLCGKRKRKDIALFSLHLTDNIATLHRDLDEKTYKHGQYRAFKINDTKPRDIHKASVRDRLLHHAIYRILYPCFDRKFIFDSYSCRRDKGTHRAINRFREYARKVSMNHTRTVWVLKCDIKKFFANIDHEILLNILVRHIPDEDALWLLEKIIKSFQTLPVGTCLDLSLPPHGLPLGNLTSQLLVNVYMNEFDQFAKRELKTKYYIRYADDFVILHEDRAYLENLLPKISGFLNTKLRLSMHPQKVSITTLSSGVDFLGWVHFPHHRILRTATKRRILKKLTQSIKNEACISYIGILSHGNTHKLVEEIKEIQSVKVSKSQSDKNTEH